MSFREQDVGVRTEMPFDLLPLWLYVDAIEASCDQIRNHRKRFLA